MAVVGAEHLDDGLAAGEGAGDADGVHGGLGARVHEAPLRQLEGAGEVLGHDDGVLGGQAELGAERRALLDGLDDGRVGVALDHAAVAVVEVADLLAVDRPDVRALAVREVDGVRVAGVIGGGDAHGHVLDGALEQLVGLGRAVLEALLLALHELGDELRGRPGSAMLGSLLTLAASPHILALRRAVTRTGPAPLAASYGPTALTSQPGISDAWSGLCITSQ